MIEHEELVLVAGIQRTDSIAYPARCIQSFSGWKLSALRAFVFEFWSKVQFLDSNFCKYASK